MLRTRAAVAAVLLLCACRKETTTLGEAISVAQPGGGTAQIFARGIQLPASATESFTTAKDGEQRLAIHVLRGAGKKADQLHGESWWLVDGVKGNSPHVNVTFELDGQGALNVSARDDDRKLSVKKAEDAARLQPAPLTEPDDDEDLEEDAAE